MAILSSSDEFLDIVDRNGSILKQELRSEVYTRGEKYFRLAEIIVRNSRGQVYIMKRSDASHCMPGLYETLGEHIHAGEKDSDAVRRGVREELGIDSSPLQFQFLGYTTPTDGSIGYCSVYLLNTDEKPALNCEHSEGCWMAPLDIIAKIKEDARSFRSNTRIIFAQYADSIFNLNSAGIV